MNTERKIKAKRLYSRRDFLKGFPLGVAGAFLLSVVSGKLITSAIGRRRQSVHFPEDSIFAPVKDRHD